MIKPHLLSTSAHIDDPIRISEYIDGYRLIYGIKNLFKSVSILETISHNRLDYLEDTNLNVFYSEIGNGHTNKGVNWLNHVTNFLNKSNINGDEVVIFITGRYKLINTNILNLIDDYMVNKGFEFIAKKDDDLYVGEIHGVHTFFIAFTKNKFLQFYNWYQTNGNKNNSIEWDVKQFLMTNEKCLILPETIIMGVETRVFDTTKNKIC